MKIFLTMIGLMIFTLFPAQAEFYEYKDAEGYLHFTNNFNEVPEDQRSGLKPMREIPLEQADANSGANDFGEQINKSQGLALEGDLQAKAEALDSEQTALNNTFETIKSEKLKLGDPPPPSAELTEKLVYQKRVDELNRKILQYERRKMHLQERVLEFNEQLRTTNKAH